MGVIRYIADLHFGHENIIAYDNRPFRSAEEMDEEMIARWNLAVGAEDLIWILGDFCTGDAARWETVLSRLSGRKALIVGNHDDPRTVKQLADSFEDIAEYREITDGGHQLILCHYPILAFRDHYFGRIHLYGHVHTGYEANVVLHAQGQLKRLYAREDVCRAYNVGAMLPRMDYTPRTLEEILAAEN